MKEPLNLFEHDDFLFSTGLSSVDMLEHPAGEDRSAWIWILGIGPFATNIATSRTMTVCGVDDFAHRDPDQQFPELLAARRGSLAFELAETKARIHALKDVLFVFTTPNAIVKVTAHQHLKPCRKPFPDDSSGLVALLAIG
jgi:hypothetical protein